MPNNQLEQSLTSFVSEVSGENHLRIEHDFGDGFVRLLASEAERRQAIQDIKCSEDAVIELLRNSRDAGATHIFLALSKQGSKRTLCIIDDGVGIPVSMHPHIFEPRVTSKLDTAHKDKWGIHGRGMALYSIAQNAIYAQVEQSDIEKGTSIKTVFDLTTLGERMDQSTFPTFTMESDRSVSVRGPKNILRCACEFALEEHSSCSVFVGSPAEIAAALYCFGCSTLSQMDTLFCKDLDSLTLVKRLAISRDPRSFKLCAQSLGIDISERTARRIMDDELNPAENILDRVVIKNSTPRQKRQEKVHRRKILSKTDLQEFTRNVQDSFEEIAERNYLDPKASAHVRVKNGVLSITIPLIEADSD